VVKVEHCEKTEFCLENLISDVKNLRLPLILIDGIYEKNFSYELSEKIFNELHTQGVIDTRKTFFLWCEFQGEACFRMINGEKIYGIDNCLKHKLLSEQKTFGVFFVDMSGKGAQCVDAIKNLISEIEVYYHNALFVLFSNEDTINLITSEAPYCKTFIYDHFADVFGDIWEKINDENKKAIRNLKGKLLNEYVLSVLERETTTKPEKDINDVLHTLIKRAMHKRHIIGFGE